MSERALGREAPLMARYDDNNQTQPIEVASLCKILSPD